MSTLGLEAGAALVWLVYASFFEWLIHRNFMHQRRFPFYDACRGHLAHHSIYRWDDTYQKEEPGRPNDVMMRWYALPSLLLMHLPLFALVERLTGIPSFWGGVVGFALYAAGYEYTHYLMHIPRGHVIERSGWYRFMREHHRLHHRYMRRNLNVFLPIADVCLGTLVTMDPAAPTSQPLS